MLPCFYRIDRRRAKCEGAHGGAARPAPLFYLAGGFSMSYVQRVLQPGEVVRHTAAVHWIVYWPGALCMALAAAIFISGIFLFDHADESWGRWLWRSSATIVALLGLFFLVREWFGWWTTEIAVTNLRVIYKTGLVQRRTKEMNMDKVESVEVDQSILGRILDYGTVSITGTGAGLESLQIIAQPIELRNSITGVPHGHDVQSTTPSR
jgi:hypothetical protein